MINLRFDHVIILVSDLEQAIKQYSDAGFTIFDGGHHADGKTQNGLIVFADGTYLELLAPSDPALLQSDLTADPASFLQFFIGGEGFFGFALHTTSMNETVKGMLSRGIQVGDVSHGGRETPDGKQLRWQMAKIDEGYNPFLIADKSPRYWRVPNDEPLISHTNGCRGIHEITIAVDSLSNAQQRFAGIIGADFEMNSDRSLSTNLQSVALRIQVFPDGPPGRTPVPYEVKLLADYEKDLPVLQTSDAKLQLVTG